MLQEAVNNWWFLFDCQQRNMLNSIFTKGEGGGVGKVKVIEA